VRSRTGGGPEATAAGMAGRLQRSKWGCGMLHYAWIFLILAIIAAIFGFGGVAAAAAGIAKFLFFIFIVLFLIGLLTGRRSV
jgi:uncharacterized membrane protein YtjA (UPF0391 family)